MPKPLKITLKIVLILLALVLLVVGGYVLYVFGTYNRIEDQQALTPDNPSGISLATTNEEYEIISYNIGFGAYSDDYSFFMDGGKYSRAFSKDAVMDNTNGDIEILDTYEPDFILLQEVDTDSTRSYHVDQSELLKNARPDFSSSFAVNFHSAYLFYPLTSPHGKSNSGLLTLSRFQNDSAVRRSLPISTDVTKIVDLDRCYVKNYIPLSNGHQFVLIDAHLSAYTSDISIVENQIRMLSNDMEEEYQKGNYVICGGDYNQDLLGNSPEIFHTDSTSANWAQPFPKEMLSEHFTLACDSLSEDKINAITPSCRNADSPYKEGESFVTMVDGFIISDNIEMKEFTTIDNGFAYSDHNPVYMRFLLKE